MKDGTDSLFPDQYYYHHAVQPGMNGEYICINNHMVLIVGENVALLRSLL